jgi:general stress protein 26
MPIDARAREPDRGAVEKINAVTRVLTPSTWSRTDEFGPVVVSDRCGRVRSRQRAAADYCDSELIARRTRRMSWTEPVAELDARFSAPEAQVTPWAEVRRLIEQAELFWISTVRPDGRPHVTPLTAVWHRDALYFCTGAGEQKGVNLARNPNCTLTTGSNAWDAGLDVVLEGRAARVTDDPLLQALADGWESKYQGDWHFEVSNGAFRHGAGEALVFEVVPAKVLAFAKGNSAQTRYRLP